MNIIYFIKEISLYIYFVIFQIILFITINFCFKNIENVFLKEYVIYETYSNEYRNSYTKEHYFSWYTKKYQTNWYIEPYTSESITYKMFILDISIFVFLYIIVTMIYITKPIIEEKTKLSIKTILFSNIHFMMFTNYYSTDIQSYYIDAKRNNIYYSYEYYIDTLFYVTIKLMILIVCIILFSLSKTKLKYRIIIYTIVIIIFSFDFFFILYFFISSELYLIFVNIIRYWR